MTTWKKIIIYGLSLLLCCSAHASTIPSYTVASVNGHLITLSDNSVLAINGIYQATTSQWMAGDVLYLGQTNLSYFPPTLIDVDGVLKNAPMFVIENTTRGSSAIGYVSTLPSLNPMLLLSINPTNNVIVSSAPTPWRIRLADRRYFIQWQTGDIMLIGKNLGSDRGTYDTVIFNATRLETVRAFELPL